MEQSVAIIDISIIIPCYNYGIYLNDALESIKNSVKTEGISYEIIIVNDGSTDAFTLDLLDRLESSDCIVLHKPNGGPASARNAGIREARAEHLIFLDSDNLIEEIFIYEALNLFRNTHADIIYGKAIFFGQSTNSRFEPGRLDKKRLFYQNTIDMCSAIRKDVWLKMGGFDESSVLIGFEDWDFWIRAVTAGYKFKFVNDFLFSYRVHYDSLSYIANQVFNKYKANNYIYDKHGKTIRQYYGIRYYWLLVNRNNIRFIKEHIWILFAFPNRLIKRFRTVT